MSNQLQRCFILHTRPFSETSLLVDVFSELNGKITVVAKGARRPKSHLRGILQPFTPLLLKWSGKSSVSTLTSAEAIGLSIPLIGNKLFSAIYLNEILERVLSPNSPYTQLFFSYIKALSNLAKDETSIEPTLRVFELELLENLGYGVDFLHCYATGSFVDDNMTYLYREQKGFIASVTRSNFSFSGKELKALAYKDFNSLDTLKAAKRFTRVALKPYIGSAPIKSRELFY